MNPLPELFSVSEAAKALRVSKSTARRLIRTGELVASNVAPSDAPAPILRVSSDTIAAFLRARAVATAPRTAAPAQAPKNLPVSNPRVTSSNFPSQASDDIANSSAVNNKSTPPKAGE